MEIIIWLSWNNMQGTFGDANPRKYVVEMWVVFEKNQTLRGR